MNEDEISEELNKNTWNLKITGKAIQEFGFENYKEAYTALYK